MDAHGKLRMVETLDEQGDDGLLFGRHGVHLRGGKKSDIDGIGSGREDS
jgi:hypothetical protein